MNLPIKPVFFTFFLTLSLTTVYYYFLGHLLEQFFINYTFQSRLNAIHFRIHFRVISRGTAQNESKKKTKTEREMIEGAKVNIGNSAHNLIYFYQHFIFVHKIFPIFFVFFFFFHFRLRLNCKHTHARTLQFYYTLLL